MRCIRCGTENIDGSSFCIKCGYNLKQQTMTVNHIQVPNQNDVNVGQSMGQSYNQYQVNSQYNQKNYQQSVQTSIYNQQNVNQNVSQSQKQSSASLNYLTYIINILLKPFKSFKEEATKLCDTKTSLIFSSIIAVAMMVITLVKSMFSVIFIKTMDLSTFKMKTTINFSGLKNLNYVNLILKNLLLYLLVIVAIAVVYNAVSLIFKKSVNFIKTLSISATSLIPYVVGMVVSPILGKIWAPLNMISLIVSIIYALLIFTSLIDDNISFDSCDKKIYLHLICLAILGSAGYYLYVKIMSSVPSGIGNLNNIFNMFK